MADDTNEKRLCPSCGSAKTVRKAVRQDLTISVCKFCTLEFAAFENQPRSNEVIDTDPDFFHGLTDSFERQLDKACDILPKRLDAYAQLLNRPINSVLEVGCATGAYAKAFDSLGIRYRAVEIDEEMASQAKAKTGLDIVCGNFMDADESEAFDLFFAHKCSSMSLHRSHLSKRPRVLPKTGWSMLMFQIIAP